MVGPHIPWPMMNIPLSLPKAPSSWPQITRSIGVAPRPPYSFGQCRQAQPASAFFFCQALAAPIGSTPFRSRLPKPEDSRSAFRWRGPLASIHARTSARKAASAGVSSKFMANSLSGRGGVAGAHAGDQLVFPLGLAADVHGEEVRAAVEQMTVESPGEAHAA